ncbi:MAG: ester cyclase [Caldilineaceae bacterium]|nr:ester cyclase [Caldilineaceae bacterium]MCB9157555.1 ester cyclase [Caldilineaceae bacterium]
MVTESNIQLVREWVEVGWNQSDPDRLADFFPPTFMNEGQPATVDVLIQWNERQRTAFPDIHYEIEDIFATDDRVALRWMATATHTGTLWGFIPSTRKHASWKGIHMLRIVDGRIAEIWATSDIPSMLQQLGVTLQLPEST